MYKNPGKWGQSGIYILLVEADKMVVPLSQTVSWCKFRALP